MNKVNYDSLPNTFILGAAKAGTTSLYRYLRPHPEVYFPPLKELYFFDARDELYCSGETQEVYEKLYKGSVGYKIRVDSTPTYLHTLCRNTPQRIADFFGGRPLKFIVLLRNPIERAFSHYLQKKNIYRAVNESFEEIIALELSRSYEENVESWTTYIADSMYGHQLKAWFQYFPRDWFKVIVSEDLKSNPAGVMKDICLFLDVSDVFDTDFRKQYNQSGTMRSAFVAKLLQSPPALMRRLMPPHMRRIVREKITIANIKAVDEKPTMNAATRQKLAELFRDDVSLLGELTLMDYSSWRII